MFLIADQFLNSPGRNSTISPTNVLIELIVNQDVSHFTFGSYEWCTFINVGVHDLLHAVQMIQVLVSLFVEHFFALNVAMNILLSGQ